MPELPTPDDDPITSKSYALYYAVATPLSSGANLFDAAGCAQCHRTALNIETGKVIRPFTDLLLHDMGTGLADRTLVGAIAPSRWRTARRFDPSQAARTVATYLALHALPPEAKGCREPAAVSAVDVAGFIAALKGEDVDWVNNTVSFFRKKTGVPVLLLLNKVDRLKNPVELLPVIEKFKTLHEFADFLPISAKNGTGLDRLLAAIIERLPDGPACYPRDYLTDQPERFLASELIREKLLHATRQEVPHAVAVVIDKWEDKKKLLRVSATIFVERESQKGIVIGEGGKMLKSIGASARQEIEKMGGRPVYLELRVKVLKDWRKDENALQRFGYRIKKRKEVRGKRRK